MRPISLCSLVLLLHLCSSAGAAGRDESRPYRNTVDVTNQLPGGAEFTEDFTLWAEGSTAKISPVEKPRSSSCVWDGRVIRIKSARAEYEPFQLVVTADKGNLNDVSVAFDDLRDDGGTVFSRENISCFLEYYVTLKEPSRDINTGTVTGKAGVFPDALPAFRPFDVAEGKNQPLWIDIHVPPETPASVYKGNMKVSTGSRALNVPLELEVWDFALPTHSSLKDEAAMELGYLAQLYGIEDENALKAMGQEYYRMLVRHRVSPSSAAWTEPPGVKDEGGKLTFDWQRTDSVLSELSDMGMSVIIAPNPYDQEKRFYCFSGNPREADFSPDFNRKVVDFYRQVYEHFREKGWEDKAYLFLRDETVWVSDEPNHNGREGYERFGKWAKLAKEAAPGFRIAIGDELIPDLDDYYLVEKYVSIFALPFEAADISPRELRRKREKGIAPVLYGNSYQDLVDFDATMHRLFGWACYRFGAGGGGLWEVTFIPRDDMNPWTDDLMNEYGNGAGFIIYPGRQIGLDSPVASIRLKLNRETVEDYEYLHILEEMGEEDFARGLANTIVPSVKDFNAPAESFYAARAAAAQHILRKGKREGFAAISGTVTSGGKPLVDAFVTNGILSYFTNDKGEFDFKYFRPRDRITVARKGYVNREVQPDTEGPAKLSVELQPLPFEKKTLFSFEEGDWKQYAEPSGFDTFGSRPEKATDGSHSLFVQKGAGGEAEMGFNLEFTGWDGYDVFAMDIHNSMAIPRALPMTITDGSSKEYYFKPVLEPGITTTVEVTLKELGKMLDTREIVYIYLGFPQQQWSLYLDDLRLIKYVD